ncbi:MATE family efflux transporter [Faecalibacterium prausnitzii]|uniref:MATE family efflux transporter n=1 Tax=Faecalibacterium prausnitzii TaxID=853 RepID=UPI003C2E3F2E
MTQTAKRSPFTMNVDLMHGPILKSLLLFMLPILVSNLFQQLYNTVDTMIVGNVLGDTALAAIGSCGSIYELLVGFGIGIGNGLAIVAARSYGAQDHDLLKKTVAGSLVIGLIASLCITLAGAVGLRPLLVLLDTPAEILEDAYRYIIVINYGVLVMFAYNLCAGLLRAIGNSVMPLVFLLLSSGLNILLDLLFIARMGMGVRGAAVATVISQGVSVLLCIAYVFAKVKLLLPEKKHFRVGRHLYWELFSQSISMGLMSSIVSAGSVVLQYGINGLGTLTIAGHTAARKMFMFTDMPLLSMASAGSTFVSQNCGAGQPDRVRKGMKEIYLYSVVMTVAAVLLMRVAAPWMVAFVSGSTEPIVLENGARYLLWNAPFYAVLGVLLCTRYALQSLGQKVLPLFSSVIELVGKVIFVLVFIPKFQYNAVILCEPIIWCFMAAYLVAVYRHDPFVFPKQEKR